MGTLDNLITLFAAGLKLVVFLLLIAILLPIALIYKKVKSDDPYRIPQFFHRLVLKLLGIRVRVHGKPTDTGPILFVSNHASYLDIIVLGSVLPTSFVAKSEVAGWPLFGTLARVQNTVFVERRATRAAEQQGQLQEHFASRKNLVLFAEGTSSIGLTALPFKSSLFSILEQQAPDVAITVQPLSITCTELDGFPMLLEDRSLYAWYGDMSLEPHLWDVFKRGHFTVDITFHAPVSMAECPNRKILAATCHERVAQGIEQALLGRH